MFRTFLGKLTLLALAACLLASCRTTPDPTFSSGLEFTDMPGFTHSDPLTQPTAQGGETVSPLPAMRQDVFRVGDMVKILFIGPDTTLIPPFEGRIQDDGTITLPLIGSVKAAGRSAGELQKDVHDQYVPKYYLRLTVTVDPQIRFYYVGGEVKSPGRQQWLGEITVTKAIQTASDFTEWANKKNVTLTRADNRTTITVNCVKALEGKAPDPYVYPGDKIHVRRRMF